MKTFEDFRNALGHKESSNRYDAFRSGRAYFGRYQFGYLRLFDFGLVRRLPGGTWQWMDGISRDQFLNNPALQDALFDAHVGAHAHYIKRTFGSFLETMITIHGQTEPSLVTLSGCIAVAHLVGPGHLRNFLRAVYDPEDGNGTKASKYFVELGGYDIPEGLPRKIDYQRFIG